MTTHIYENLAVLLRTRVPTRQLPCWFSKTVLRTPSIGERHVVHISIVCGLNRKFYKQCNSQRPICDMQFTVVANESNRELRWQGASGWAHPVFYYASSFSARSIRYPTPTWVWIRCGASGYRSNFFAQGRHINTQGCNVIFLRTAPYFLREGGMRQHFAHIMR